MLHRDAWVDALQPYPLRLLVEIHLAEVGDDDRGSSSPEALSLPCPRPVYEPGACEVVQLLDEFPLVVCHDHDDTLCAGDDVVSASASGQPHRWPLKVTDEGGVYVAVLIDLSGSHETDVYSSALEKHAEGFDQPYGRRCLVVEPGVRNGEG